MGLAIVHGIVTSYGGFVTGTSKPEKGPVFRVFFPAVEQEVVLEVGEERLRLVDDEEMLTGMGKATLENLGYEVTTRTSSLEALTIFQDQPDRFDVVITDQTMPGLTGSDLARHMLKIRPDLPIILCTGDSSLSPEEEARSSGIKGFAMKPLTQYDLSALIKKVLDKKRTASEIRF